VRDVAVPALALGVWSGRDRNVDGDLPSSSVRGASSTPAQALARAKRRRAASLPASCSSRNSTSALSSPTASAWRPRPEVSVNALLRHGQPQLDRAGRSPPARTAHMRNSARGAPRHGKRGAGRRYRWVTDYTPWNEANPCSQPTREHPRMVGARRSAVRGVASLVVVKRSPNGAGRPEWRCAPRRDGEEAYDRIASGPGPDLPA
jgi:hypothetical protein